MGVKVDKIRLAGLKFYGYHGVYEEENRLGQRFYVDVELMLPLHKSGLSDQLEDTINYAEACALIQAIVEGKPFKLLEALAEHIASQLLANYTNIREVKVQVNKPHPPMALHMDGIYVEIHRKREQ